MKEITSSITDWVKERFSSSIFANFIFVWIIWNWRFVYITLFLPGMVGGRINKLEFYDLDKSEGFSILCPLLIALAITLGFPWINSIVSVYKYKVKRKRMNWELEYVDKFDPIPASTYYQEKKKWLEKEKEFNEAITLANQLKVDILDKDEQISKFKVNTLSQEKIISQNEREIESNTSIINEYFETIEKLEKQLIEIKLESAFPEYLLDKVLLLMDENTSKFKEMFSKYNDVTVKSTQLKTIQFSPNKLFLNNEVWSIRTMKTINGKTYILSENDSSFLDMLIEDEENSEFLNIKIQDIRPNNNQSGVYKVLRNTII
jgi:hypothetical protein